MFGRLTKNKSFIVKSSDRVLLDVRQSPPWQGIEIPVRVQAGNNFSVQPYLSELAGLVHEKQPPFIILVGWTDGFFENLTNNMCILLQFILDTHVKHVHVELSEPISSGYMNGFIAISDALKEYGVTLIMPMSVEERQRQFELVDQDDQSVLLDGGVPQSDKRPMEEDVDAAVAQMLAAFHPY